MVVAAVAVATAAANSAYLQHARAEGSRLASFGSITKRAFRRHETVERRRLILDGFRKATPLARDIDYAATAVKSAIVEKFGRSSDLQHLQVIAREKTISVSHAGRTAEGTRDALLAAVRAANSYDELWEVLPVSSNTAR